MSICGRLVAWLTEAALHQAQSGGARPPQAGEVAALFLARADHHTQRSDPQPCKRRGAGPIWDIERDDGAEHPRMRFSAMAQRKQDHLQIQRAVVVGLSDQSRHRRNLAVGNAFELVVNKLG